MSSTRGIGVMVAVFGNPGDSGLFWSFYKAEITCHPLLSTSVQSLFQLCTKASICGGNPRDFLKWVSPREEVNSIISADLMRPTSALWLFVWEKLLWPGNVALFECGITQGTAPLTKWFLLLDIYVLSIWTKTVGYKWKHGQKIKKAEFWRVVCSVSLLILLFHAYFCTAPKCCCCF